MSYENSDVLRCPFNKNHAISKTKFQRHLVKCEKNFPSDYKVVCPFDATHRVSKDTVIEHLNTCPMRRVLEGNFIQPSTDNTVASVKDNSISEAACKDFWNSDAEAEIIEPFRTVFKQSEPAIRSNASSIADGFEFRPNAMSIGRGRRRSSYNHLSDTESICSEDVEGFMLSKMAIGRGRMLATGIKYHQRFDSRGRRY